MSPGNRTDPESMGTVSLSSWLWPLVLPAPALLHMPNQSESHTAQWLQQNTQTSNPSTENKLTLTVLTPEGGMDILFS